MKQRFSSAGGRSGRCRLVGGNSAAPVFLCGLRSVNIGQTRLVVRIDEPLELVSIRDDDSGLGR